MAHVLLVARKPGNAKALGQALGQHGYTVAGLTEPGEIQATLDGGPTPDVALVDVSGFRDEIWEACAHLQRKQVPFLVISGPQKKAAGQGLRYGAASVLEKPLAKASLLALLDGLTKR